MREIIRRGASISALLGLGGSGSDLSDNGNGGDRAMDDNSSDGEIGEGDRGVAVPDDESLDGEREDVVDADTNATHFGGEGGWTRVVADSNSWTAANPLAVLTLGEIIFEVSSS